MSNEENKFKNSLLNRLNFGGRLYKLQDADLDNIESYQDDNNDNNDDNDEITKLEVSKEQTIY